MAAGTRSSWQDIELEASMTDFCRWENEGGAPVQYSTRPRLNALKRRHRRIHAQIDLEEKRPNACSMEIGRLKREKLSLKDQIITLTQID